MKRLMLSTLALACFAGAAMAQQPASPNAIIMGPGTHACSAWLADRQQPGNIVAEARLVWVTGYLTAFNYTALEPSQNITEGLNLQQVAAQIDIYCRQDPNQALNYAVLSTLRDLLRRKGYDPASIGRSPPYPRLAQ